MTKYLSTKERENLLSRHKSEKDRKAGDRIKAILLTDDGWNYRQVACALFIDEETVSRHIKDYQQKRKLKNTSGGSESKLKRRQSEEFITHLEKYTYFNAYLIIAYVREKHEITYRHSGMVARVTSA